MVFWTFSFHLSKSCQAISDNAYARLYTSMLHLPASQFTVVPGPYPASCQGVAGKRRLKPKAKHGPCPAKPEAKHGSSLSNF